jgi:hypothetical protein
MWMIGALYNRILGKYFTGASRKKREAEEIRDWDAKGRPPRPPRAVKFHTIAEYRNRSGIRTLIETGTYLGDMVESCRGIFDRVISIELSRELYEEAKSRFASDPRISILQGDSSDVLARTLPSINEPCLFWLDAHYSGGITAQGTVLTPIYQELRSIFEHAVEDHVVLIDDASDFIGTEGYPTITELKRFVFEHRPHASFEVKDDIIRIHS